MPRINASRCIARAVCFGSITVGAMTGCQSNARSTGVRIGDPTLDQFEAGITTEGWVVAILGEPTNESVVEGVENTKVFHYTVTESRGGVLSIFTGSGHRTTAVVYFIITNGVVTRFWADREIDRTITGEPIESTEGDKENR